MRHYLRDGNVDINIGRVLRVLCRAHELTQQQLAEKFGMSMSALNERLAGKRRFTAVEIAAFAEHFGVDPGVFFKDPVELVGSPSPAKSQSRWTVLCPRQRPFPARCHHWLMIAPSTPAGPSRSDTNQHAFQRSTKRRRTIWKCSDNFN